MLPLAERMRPKTLDEYIGQKHLVGEGAILRKMIESGNIASFETSPVSSYGVLRVWEKRPSRASLPTNSSGRSIRSAP